MFIETDHVYQMEAMKLLALLPPESIDATVSDVAYASLEAHRATGTTTRLTNEWFDVIPNEDVQPLAEALWRVHKPRTFAYIMVDTPSEEVWGDAFREAGWWKWGSWPWFKVSAKRMQKHEAQILEHLRRRDYMAAFQLMADMGMGYHGRRSHERVMLLERCGTKQARDRTKPTGLRAKLRDRKQVDVLCYAVEEDVDYPTAKPIALMRRLVECITDPRDVVLDFNMGSGSTLVAAAQGRRDGTHRHYIGCDKSRRAYEQASERLALVSHR